MQPKCNAAALKLTIDATAEIEILKNNLKINCKSRAH
jgi:hypothetical protein